ncbi:MAG: hypothetical protein Q7S40_07840 [Opitutaceae bacterium]|nr:hypothetical protein [Opitutaceae bacterium]
MAAPRFRGDGQSYHLALETPKSNLVSGMQWLQSTFAVPAHLKAMTDVSNGWLAEQLDIGSHFYVSKHVVNLRKSPLGEARQMA